MSERFYLANEKHVRPDGTINETGPHLYFQFSRASLGDSGKAPAYEFDGKATKEHVQNYAPAYLRFKQAFPDFKLPWGDDADFVGIKAQAVGTMNRTEIVPEVSVEAPAVVAPEVTKVEVVPETKVEVAPVVEEAKEPQAA